MSAHITKGNINILKASNPSLYDAIYTEDPLFEVEIEELENNLIVSASQAKCYLNSTFSIEDECRMMFRDIREETEIVILLGIANGIALGYINKYYRNVRKIFVIEPTNQIIKTVLTKQSIVDWIQNNIEVSIILNKSVEISIGMLAGLLEENDIGKTCISVSSAYVALFPNWCVEVMKNLQSYVQHKILRMNTNRYFLYRWPLNIFRNLKNNEMGVEAILNAIDTRVGVLVSGGPSLEYDLEILRKVTEDKRATVFAVGSAIKILDSHRINPNYRMAIDGNDGQKKIFNNLNNNQIPLIHATSSFHEIIVDYAGPTFRCVLTSDFIAEYIYQLAQVPHMSILSGYSVATSALDLMVQLGFQKIILLGQDLCFSDGKHYTSGSWMNEKIDDFDQQKLKLKKMISNSGTDVYTNVPFVGIRKAIEQVICKHPEIEFINTSRNGVVIEGATFKILDEDLVHNAWLQADFSQKNVAFDRISEAEYIKLIKIGISKYRNELVDLEKITNQIIDKCENGLSDTEDNAINQLNEIQKLEEAMNGYGCYTKTIIPVLSDRLQVITQQSFSEIENDNFKNLTRVVSALSEIKTMILYYLELIAEFDGDKIYQVIYED